MKYILMDRGVWDIIDEEKSDKVTDEVIGSFRTRANQDLSLIFLNVEQDFKRIIEGCFDSVSAWRKLKSNFHPDTPLTICSCFQNLLNPELGTVKPSICFQADNEFSVTSSR